jgi:8-oxo-dGTP diphosphatase
VTTYTSKYPIFGVTVDLVLLRKSPDTQNVHDVLLVKRGEEPYKGRLALPGGHLNIDERAIDGAVRECEEETGVKVSRDNLHFVCVLDAPDRDPRGRYISIVYAALLEGDSSPEGADDAEWAGWLSVGNAKLNKNHMAFDHGTALDRAVDRMLGPG